MIELTLDIQSMWMGIVLGTWIALVIVWMVRE